MSIYKYSELEERYITDASFHRLVAVMYDAILLHGLTPSELREALFFAHYKYEMENPREVQIGVKKRMKEVYGEE